MKGMAILGDCKGKTVALLGRRRALLLGVLLATAPWAVAPIRADGVAGELFTDATRFTEETRFRLPGVHNGWRLGTSVAMTEDLLVAGAPYAHYGSQAQGAVAVFDRGIAGTWTRRAVLTASDAQAGDRLGSAVGVSGDTVVAVAPTAGRQAVYIFEKPPGGWADATETARLTASDGEPSFGFSVAISGDTVAVGAPLADVLSMDTGAVYLFDRPGSGWVDMHESTKLVNPVGLFGALFGTSVVLDGDTMVVGAPLDDGDFSTTGGVGYLFERGGGGWGPGKVLLASDRSSNQLIGGSVAIHGDTVVLGTGYYDFLAVTDHLSTDSAAYVFVKPAGGWPGAMLETAKLAFLAPTSFGMAVAAGEDLVLVGAPRGVMPWFGFPFPEGGQVYAFDRPPGGWVDAVADIFNPLHPSSVEPCTTSVCGLYFGFSLALSSTTAVVGAPGAGELDSVYTFVDPPITLFDDGFESGDTSAWSVVVP